MRCKSWYWGLALLLATSAGCKQQVFLTLDDAKHYQDLAMMSHHDIENDPTIINKPLNEFSLHPPKTILDPDRNLRYMSLAECIAIALEQGTTGSQNYSIVPAISTGGPLTIFGGGTISDALPAFPGPGARLSSDSIRVLSIDPAINGATIEASLSKFDANWITSAVWQTIDRPVGTSQDLLTSGGQVTTIMTESFTGTTALVKPLPTGGVAGITFALPYQITNQPARVNPSYSPALTFSIEQPLLQGYGVEINQLRAAHPGAVLNPNLQGTVNAQTSQEGILISRVRFDESRAEFERVVNAMVTNVEIAYWRLYGSYWNIYQAEQGMRQAYEAWKIAAARLAAGRISRADYAQARGQYELFRGQRLDALENTLENERQLRGLLNLPSDDGTRLIPSDSPTLAPYVPDWATGLQEALALRPELFIARQEVKVAQMNLILQKNSLLPDLRFFANWDINGLGGRLDGPDPNTNALRNLAEDRFHNWTIGLRYVVPIGFRLANTNVRIARLNLARALDVLDTEEKRAERFLSVTYRQVIYNYERIRVTRARREAFAEQLDAQFRIYQAGKGTLDLLLEAQRNWAAALLDEYTSIVFYQQALVFWEWSKGTVLRHDNIVIGDGPLPCCVAQRAVEHLKERTAAIVKHERAVYDPTPKGCQLPSLPGLYKVNPPMTEEPPAIKPPPGTPDIPPMLPPAAKLPDAVPGGPVKTDLPPSPVILPPAPPTGDWSRGPTN